MSSERSEKAASRFPDLDQLAALVDADDDSPSAAPADESSGAPGSPTAEESDDVDDAAPTDYYHSVKPKPKAVPIAEVGTDDQPEVEQEESPKRRIWVWLALALLLTGGLAVAGILHHGQESGSASPKSALVPSGASMADKAAAVHRRVSRAGSPDDHPLNPRDPIEPGFDVTAQAPVAGAATPVRFERRGQAILVPVRVRGPSGSRSVKMVLDTGATFTTVTPKTLAAVGAEPSRVSARVETANGVVTRPLAVLDGVALAGAGVGSGLTVGVCEACAIAGTEGLLGLNFARHFVVTVDHEAGQLLLAPKSLGDKTMDIRPFVALLDAESQRSGSSVAIRFSIRNKAPRALRDVVIEATSPGLPAKPRTRIAHVAAGGRRQATIEGALVGELGARTFTLEVVRASW